MTRPKSRHAIITPELFVAHVRGAATPAQSERVKLAIEDKDSELNGWLSRVAKNEHSFDSEQYSCGDSTPLTKGHPHNSRSYERYAAMTHFLRYHAKTYDPNCDLEAVHAAAKEPVPGDPAQIRSASEFHASYQRMVDYLEKNYPKLLEQFRDSQSRFDSIDFER